MWKPHTRHPGAPTGGHHERRCSGAKTILEVRDAPSEHRFLPFLAVCLIGVSCSKPLRTSTATGGSSGRGGVTVAGTGGQASGGADVGAAGSGGAGFAGSGGGRRGTGGSVTGGSGATRPRSGGSGNGGVALGGTTAAVGSGTGGATGTGGHRDAGSGGGNGTGGAAIDGGTKFVGNITTKEQIAPAGLAFADYWDQITPEHAGLWGSVQSRPGGSFEWSALDAMYAYSQDEHIVFKEYYFVGGSYQPGQPYSEITESDVRAWMRGFCERYPQTKLIDVVNEPLHSVPHYADNIGGGTKGDWKWITNVFAWAREACPDATLMLNEYGTIENADDNLALIALVKTIKAAGAPIQAIGVQAYSAGDVSSSTVRTLLERLNQETGLPLYITAYQVPRRDDDEQLRIYQSQFPLFWQAEYVHGITLWGWIYENTGWNGWLVRDATVRPAMTWLTQYLGRTAR